MLTVHRNNRRIYKGKSRGFTLIEVLIAMVILIISMLAVLHALLTTIQQNLNNLMMDEAVRIAEEYTNSVRNTSYASVTSGGTAVSRKFRDFTETFNVTWTVTNISVDTKVVRILVTWTVRGVKHEHTAATVRTNST